MGGAVDLHEVAGKEFLVGWRGYVREDVRVYLRAVSAELLGREALITDLRHQLDEANRELADTKRRLDEATRQLEETNGPLGGDRATLVKLVGQEASAILSAADGAAERIRFEAERYAESVRDGLVFARSHLAQLYRNLGQLLDEIEGMERAGALMSFAPDVGRLGSGNGSGAAEETGVEAEPMSEVDGESEWPWPQ
jgi:cell division septum initiation protein DivIVA